MRSSYHSENRWLRKISDPDDSVHSSLPPTRALVDGHLSLVDLITASTAACRPHAL